MNFLCFQSKRVRAVRWALRGRRGRWRVQRGRAPLCGRHRGEAPATSLSQLLPRAVRVWDTVWVHYW